jgi:hypothetical protein
MALMTPAVLLAASACAVRLGGPEPASAPAGADDDVPRIGVDEAHAAVLAGRAVLIDVRSRESFERSHAAGAMLLPLDQIEQAPQNAARALPAGKQPIFYCT